MSGRRILVGNRDLMNHYSVDVPAVQIDREHGHQLVYLAAGNEVVGAFVLAYHVSSEKKQRNAAYGQKMESDYCKNNRSFRYC